MSKYKIKPNYCYLIEETKPELSLKIFQESISGTNHGLCISRKSPLALKEELQLDNVKFIWLSNNQTEMSMDPKNLTRFGKELCNFIRTVENSVILFLGIEYLITQNNFEMVLNLLFFLQDEISVNQSSLIISLDPKIFKENEIKLIERFMEILPNEKSEN
jgi:archaellum biogenesis ATPase FlaH